MKGLKHEQGLARVFEILRHASACGTINGNDAAVAVDTRNTSHACHQLRIMTGMHKHTQISMKGLKLEQQVCLIEMVACLGMRYD